MKKNIFTLLSVVILFVGGCNRTKDASSLPRGEVSNQWSVAAKKFRTEAKKIDKPSMPGPLSIMAVERGKVVFEKWYEGYTPDSVYNTYSISKTVLALAAGCAVDEGLINVDDKVADYFSDKLPDTASDSLSSMTLRHLLTMTSGLEETPKLLGVFRGNKDFDWTEEFFNSTLTSLPGTQFYYNLFAPCIVASMLEKRIGMNVVDYIKPRLLEPMHITDLEWEKTSDGTCIGAWGMSACTEDLAKIGQLLLQHGEWNGRQLVSKEWVDTMTSKLIPSTSLCAFTKGIDPALLSDKNDDHAQGYGYYVWQGKYGSYRAEGLDGRYIIISPTKQTVFVITSHSAIQQQVYIDLIWEMFGHLMK